MGSSFLMQFIRVRYLYFLLLTHFKSLCNINTFYFPVAGTRRNGAVVGPVLSTEYCFYITLYYACTREQFYRVVCKENTAEVRIALFLK